jgi:uncharacterized membrane protein
LARIVQLVDEAVQPALFFEDQGLDGLQPFARRVAFSFNQQVLGRFQLQGDTGQGLQQAVVQVARQALAFFHHRRFWRASRQTRLLGDHLLAFLQ